LLGGVDPVVLERLPGISEIPKGNGLVGQIVPTLDYRGLFDRLRQEATWGGPVPGFSLTELGGTVRRGHELTALSSGDDAVTLDARGPGGAYQLRARYRFRSRRGGVPGPGRPGHRHHRTLPDQACSGGSAANPARRPRRLGGRA
jgi:hypothetical protein